MEVLEANLMYLAQGCPRCAALNLSMYPTRPFGLQVVRNGQAMGIWSERNGALTFRNLASWHHRIIAKTPAEAIELTIAMAEKNSWLA